MFDLIPLLTTIASCSGTFIAIVGGFIARKLISMSQERHAIDLRLAEISEQVKSKRKRIDQLTEKYRLDRFSSEVDYSSDIADFLLRRLYDCEKLSEEIQLHEFQRQQLLGRKEGLKDPHGMKKSLLVFVVFSLFGVILPLILIPFQTESYRVFVMVKIVSILLFAGCLAYAYYYFLYLLRWKNRDVVKRWREYFSPEKRNRD